MNKKLNTFFSLVFLFNVCGCNNEVSSSISSSLNEYTPTTELEKALYKLKDNNFSIDFYDSYYNNNNVERNSKFYYTNYSFQGEGDFGFVGVAQGKNLIFRYTLKDNEVVPGTPLINSNTGTRYESIFDYRESYGMNNFDYSCLPTEKDSNGYYKYKFGVNEKNDKLILPIFLRLIPESLPPEELRIKVVKDVITFDATVLKYDFNNDGKPDEKDKITAIVYDIGKTENKEIKQYLENGKTSRTPLDLKFYKFFHPYLFSNNYSVDLDATSMKDVSGNLYNFKMTEYCTENAILDIQGNANQGYMMNQGVVSTYTVENDKVKILGTQQNQDGEFIQSLYGEFMSYTLSSVTYDILIGYKDDTNDNIYYLTDSYLIYILGYICYNEIYDENYCSEVKLEIINEETYEFNLYFNMFNKKANRDLGVYKAHFYNLNNTVISAVDQYYSLGDNPNTQTKDNLKNVLNLFKNHNYSMDGITDAGMAKYYNTPNYFYVEIYGNPSQNFGFIKENNSIYEFSISKNNLVIDYSIDYASGNNPLEMVSIGSFFGSADDFGFISAIDDEVLYDINNYTIANIYGEDYWKITDLTLANKILKYYLPYNDIRSTGVGVVVKDAGVDSKITFLSSFVTNDGYNQGFVTYTYYDIGTTSHPIIDNYLNSL